MSRFVPLSFAAVLAALVLSPASAQEPASAAGLKLAADTPVRLTLLESVSSGDAKKGDRVRFQVMEDVIAEGGTVLIRRGAPAVGSVIHCKRAKFPGRKGELRLAVEYTQSADGQRVPLKAEIHRGKSDTADKVIGAAGSLLKTGFSILGGPLGGIFGGGGLKGKNIHLEPGMQAVAFVEKELIVRAAPFGLPGEGFGPAIAALPGQPALPAAPGLTPPAGAPMNAGGPLPAAVPVTPAPAAARLKALTLTSGERIVGRLVSLADGIYQVETRHGVLRIPETEVREIVDAAPAEGPAAATVARK